MTYTHTSLAAQPKGVGETCCHFLSFLLTLNFNLLTIKALMMLMLYEHATQDCRGCHLLGQVCVTNSIPQCNTFQFLHLNIHKNIMTVIMGKYTLSQQYAYNKIIKI